MKLIVDRFEEELAVCEYGEGETLEIPRLLLPPEVKEGDVLQISIDSEESLARKYYAEKLRKKMFRRE